MTPEKIHLIMLWARVIWPEEELPNRPQQCRMVPDMNIVPLLPRIVCSRWQNPSEKMKIISPAVYEPGMKTGSMVSAFVNAYVEETKVPVVGVSCSKGGSAIAEWLPGTPYYRDAVCRMKRCEAFLKKQGIPIVHRFMVWCRGMHGWGSAYESGSVPAADR